MTEDNETSRTISLVQPHNQHLTAYCFPSSTHPFLVPTVTFLKPPHPLPDFSQHPTANPSPSLSIATTSGTFPTLHPLFHIPWPFAGTSILDQKPNPNSQNSMVLQCIRTPKLRFEHQNMVDYAVFSTGDGYLARMPLGVGLVAAI